MLVIQISRVVIYSLLYRLEKIKKRKKNFPKKAKIVNNQAIILLFG